MSVEEEEGKRGNYKVQAWTGEGVPTGASGTDAPPEAFVQRIEHPGGDVVVSPMLEALRAWLRKGRDESEAPAEPATARPAAADDDHHDDDRSAAAADPVPAKAGKGKAEASARAQTVSESAQKRQGASEGGRSR